MQRAHPVTDEERKDSDEFDPEGVARRQSSPYTGKLSARPAGKPGGFFHVLENLRRSLPRHSTSAAGYTRAALLRFPGMAESIGPMEFKTKKQNQNISNPSGGAASRGSAPDAR
jgi:hypothetical protein